MRRLKAHARKAITALTARAVAVVATEPRRCTITASVVSFLIGYTAISGGLANVVSNGENIVALGAGTYASVLLAYRLAHSSGLLGAGRNGRREVPTGANETSTDR